jgi:N-sulfoglucosamine sulfohydrolase
MIIQFHIVILSLLGFRVMEYNQRRAFEKGYHPTEGRMFFLKASLSRRPTCPASPAIFALSFALAIAGLTIGCAVRRPSPEPAPRPNILVIMSDDQSWSPTGAANDPVSLTPAIDRLAREGVVFNRAFVACPSCSPSRAALFTGQAIWRLRDAANQGGPLDVEFTVYPDLLQLEGYFVGFTGKGWAPGKLEPTYRSRNPAGESFNEFGRSSPAANFAAFLDSIPGGTPFCFWWGSLQPHRPFMFAGSGGAGAPPAVYVPPIWPNVPAVAQDIAEYLSAVQLFDEEVAAAIELLTEHDKLDNTLIVVASDNGMPFPCAKATLYDRGTRVPLVVWWRGRIPGGRVIDDFVSLTDLAPTFLEAAGRKPPGDMTGRSLMNILRSAMSGRVEPERDFVVTARERHADCRAGSVGYPSRAIRTNDYLYIRNYAPERWPAGDPPMFGDIDSWNMAYSALTKEYMMDRRNAPDVEPLFRRCFDKRPAEELYDLRNDPHEMINVLDPQSGGGARPREEYETVRRELAGRLDRYLKETGDPRELGGTAPWDTLAPDIP